MSILNNLFGKKPAGNGDNNEPQQAPNNAQSPEPQQKDQPAKPDKIRAFDSFGREVLIPREEWRTNFLEKNIKEAWDKADQLSFMILKALEDGFESDVIEAAVRLREIDEKKERGWTLLGIVYMSNNDLDNANKVFSEYIEKFGESSVILTNLAKVCARRGETTVAMEMLWHALELDPNQDNGFMWFVSIQREKSPQAAKEAINRIAALPNAWRARIWQAHDALDSNELERAVTLYQEALGMMEKPIAPDILQQISGDLGRHGHLVEVLKIVAPFYQPALHGVMVGNNIIKAHVDLGQLDAAKALVETLFAQKRPDWHRALSYWDMEIAKAKSELATEDLGKNAQIELLAFDGPTWLRRDIPAATLTPAKANPPAVIAITSASFTALKDDDGKPRMQVSNIPGIMARALSIFMVEQIHFRTDGVARILQPWIANENGGFALFGTPCEDATACTLSKSAQVPAGYVAIPHMTEGENVWSASIRLLNSDDHSEIGVVKSEITPKDLEPGFRALTDAFMKLLEEKNLVKPAEAPAFYQVPSGQDFSNYQLRLEQALIVSISASSPARSRSLHGEREIVEGTLRMCLANPLNGTLRLLLARILSDMRRIHPSVVDEYRDRVAILEKSQPSPEAVQPSVNILFSQAFRG